MRKKTILIPMFLALFICCWLTGPVASAATRSESRSAGQPAIDIARLESRIHDLINLERKNAGLPDLAWNQALQQIARDYSQDMATRNFFSHTDPEGRTFVERYRRAGFKCAIRKGFFFGMSTNRGGENIAYNHLSSAILRRKGQTLTSGDAEDQFAAAVVRQWMTSASHRRNILTRDFRREGIGVAIGKDGKVLITQNFC
ncbi:MAG: CAP domain-containing protein [Proteobacteria bacterium]|nr:CAP domain-containing protein [Pseudomonadota bacterium]MBU4118398.1 CAP domain-containing protein [Pseudomonadota bacterium]